ncbi:MAG: type VII toxin-antitoxin system MntA family adenylyltransferase antitoxin [Nitrospirota bacterium]
MVYFAYLFGSRVKGITGKRSDWDIAIYFSRDPKSLPVWTIFQLEAEISREIEGEVQIITLNSLNSPIFPFQIISDGLILIDRDPEKRILYEATVLKQYHDWHFFLKRHMTSR